MSLQLYKVFVEGTQFFNLRRTQEALREVRARLRSNQPGCTLTIVRLRDGGGARMHASIFADSHRLPVIQMPMVEPDFPTEAELDAAYLEALDDCLDLYAPEEALLFLDRTAPAFAHERHKAAKANLQDRMIKVIEVVQ